jgi:CubicO group peptidase (beta-lactamase class C family)
MRRLLVPLCAATVFCAPVAAQPCGASPAPPAFRDGPVARTAAERSRQVDALFEPWARRAGPGVAVLVVERGRVVHARGYGVADVASGAPITPGTRFDLASLTKQFTGTAVLQLAERGALSLEDSVAHHLPRFRRHTGVRVRDLLDHTAGIPDYIAHFRGRGPAHTAFPRTERGPGAVPEPSMAEMLDTLSEMPLRFVPGMGYDYSNGGYLVAAAVVERASGMPFGRYLHERIFVPAGMASAEVVRPGTEDAPGRARSFGCRDGRWTRLDYTPLEHMLGAVGVVASLDDLGHWYAALDGSTLLRPETQAAAGESGFLLGGQTAGYGLGWVVAGDAADPRLVHGGWWKGFRNIALRFPREGLTVVLLGNDEGFAPLRSEMAFRTARVWLRGGGALPAARAVPARELARLAGTYTTRDGRRSYEVRAADSALSLRAAGGSAVRLRPLGGDAFFVEGFEDRRFRFETDARGLRMSWGEWGLGSTVATRAVAYRR